MARVKPFLGGWWSGPPTSHRGLGVFLAGSGGWGWGCRLDRSAGCNEPSVLAFPADTPIEEFTPTPAFPALQYLESVDEGGVAWQAGLRTGDFLIEVGRRVRIFPLGRAPTL